MSTTLRDFISQREAEIKDQQRALKAEMRELQLAKAALDSQSSPTTNGAAVPTIKEMARDVLTDAPNGMTSGEILVAIKDKYGRDVDRTSLSPQLSRLKDNDGELALQGEKWFTKAAYKAWHDRLMERAGEEISRYASLMEEEVPDEPDPDADRDEPTFDEEPSF